MRPYHHNNSYSYNIHSYSPSQNSEYEELGTFGKVKSKKISKSKIQKTANAPFNPLSSPFNNNFHSHQSSIGDPFSTHNASQETYICPNSDNYRTIMIQRLNSVNLSEDDFEEFIKYTTDSLMEFVSSENLKKLLIVISKEDFLLNFEMEEKEYKWLEKAFDIRKEKAKLNRVCKEVRKIDEEKLR